MLELSGSDESHLKDFTVIGDDLDYARSAIEAMREPTDAMADEGYRAIAKGADAVWIAMIDAALKE